MKRILLLISIFVAGVFSSLHAQKNSDVCLAPEENAEFVGGKQAMLDWIYENQRPVCGCAEKIEARFVVMEDGSIGRIEILHKGSLPGQDEEVIRLLKSMPRWKPGRNKGQIVKSLQILWIQLHAPMYISDNGSTITGQVDCCADEYYKWELDRKTQVLTVSGAGKIRYDRRWENVTTVQFGADVKSCDFLRRCKKLKKVLVDDANEELASLNGLLTDKNKEWLLVYPAGLVRKKYIVPSGIKSISGGSFDNAQIDTLVIQSGVGYINSSAFENAKIKCFKVNKNNPSYSVRHGVVCDKERMLMCFSAYHTDIPYITTEQFKQNVIECTNQECLFKGKKPVVLIFNSNHCTYSVRFINKMKMLYTAYKGRIDFYMVDIADRNVSYIAKTLDVKLAPTLFALNGAYNGELIYMRKHQGDIQDTWENYDQFCKSCDEMLAGVNLRKQK